MIRTTLRLVLAAALAAVAAAGQEPAQPGCRSAFELAERLLAGDGGQLPVHGELGFDDQASDGGRLVVTVALDLPAATLRRLAEAGGSALCFALVLDDGDALRTYHHRQLSLGTLGGAEGLTYGFETVLPEETELILALVEAPGLGLWGGTEVEPVDQQPLPGPAAVRVPGRQRAWYEVRGPAAPATAAAAEATATANGAVVRLVPPRQQPASGSTRIYALTSSPRVDRVRFYLDGAEVKERGKRPYYATFDLARPPRPQVVRAAAYDAGGRLLGEDELVVNQLDNPFRVRITELAGDPKSGEVEVAAQATVPVDATLAGLELYLNDRLIERFDASSFRTRVAVPDPGPDDFLRVAAVLADGRSIDDVVLLASPGLTEEVEVNLVALYTVVTDPQGRPIDDLERSDFTIRLRDDALPVDVFSYADDVPLVLGLVIDTSMSMFMVMSDTRRAAARFLQQTMRDGDRGFVVDFDQRPRLLHPTTGDVVALLGVLGGLEAEGLTSLYDAIIFSMVELETQRGRKALVVLTDGADLESRFGPKDCIDYGRRLGVPIYIIALANQLGTKLPKRELGRVAEQTGGRLFFVESVDLLGATYAAINAELRSQYALGFYAESDLSADDRRALRVEVKRPAARVRTVVGSDPGP
ncbi:MAG: VWA domain-containing protein [Acidobacteria bacterium]|nr:MAG: VWA domain-containing protein [Acidobacteriota bacterium]